MLKLVKVVLSSCCESSQKRCFIKARNLPKSICEKVRFPYALTGHAYKLFKNMFNDYLTRVGISGTTAKSRKRKFVPSSHPGHFAVVANKS